MKAMPSCSERYPRWMIGGLAAAAMTATGGAFAQDSLTIASGGGAYARSQLEAFHKPFAEATGIVINQADYNYELGPIRAQVEAGNVTWDVVDAEYHAVVRGCEEGLFERVDASILPAAPDGDPAVEDFIEGSIHECGIGTIVWSQIVAYDERQFPDEKPETLADFFDVEKFPGKRGLKRWPKVNLEFALIADGVPPEDVYPTLSTEAGVERAFAKLDRIKDDIVWWEAGAQAVQLLADGEVVMTSAFNGRVYAAIADEDQPFAIIWDGQVWDMDLWSVVKGTKNLDAAMKFIAFASRPERMAHQAEIIAYSPVRESALPMVADAVRPHLPTYEPNFRNALQNDAQWWADHLDALNVRFNAWLAR